MQSGSTVDGKKSRRERERERGDKHYIQVLHSTANEQNPTHMEYTSTVCPQVLPTPKTSAFTKTLGKNSLHHIRILSFQDPGDPSKKFMLIPEWLEKPPKIFPQMVNGGLP